MPEIKVPELAESITEGTIAQWLKKKGDQIQKGDYLVELETDKVNVEIISDFSGTLSELKFSEGDTVKVGETIAVVSEDGEAENNPTKMSERHEEQEETDKSESHEEQKETDKLESPPESPKKNEPHPEGDKVSDDQDSSLREEKKQRTIASPAARKLAREKGIDIADVPTVDPMGRVRRQDVTSFQAEPKSEKTTENKNTSQGTVSLNNKSETKPIVHEKMSRRRQTIAKRLVEVQQTAAMLTTFNEVDMTEVLKLRNKRKNKFFEEHDVKLGFMSFFTKAAVIALKKYPYLNAEISGDEFLVKKFYDIGIAVSAAEGLVVPVVRDADRKSFADIEKDIMELAEKARANKLALKDLQGGTFTITNGGVFGSLLSTPILNGPQVGILGMHKIQLRPVAIDEERMENRPMMYIALSYDHRIVDGKEAVSFLVKIKELLEDPEAFLLEG